MLPGSSSEVVAPSKGGESAPSRPESAPSRPPFERGPAKTPRFVQQTLGKLKLDSSRIEQNGGRHHKPALLPEVLPTATAACRSPTPELQPAGSRPGTQSGMRDTPDSLMAEYLQRSLQDSSGRPDSRASTLRPESSSRPEPPGSQASTRESPCFDTEYRNFQSTGSCPTSASDALREVSGSSWPAWSQDITGRPWIIADLARWSTAFHEEMQQCVHEVKSALEESNIQKMVNEFAEWRQAEKQEKTELRKHVEELLRVNVSLRQTQLDWFTTKGVDHIVNAAVSKACKAGSQEALSVMQEKIDNKFCTKSLERTITSNLENLLKDHHSNVTTTLTKQQTRERWKKAASAAKLEEQMEGFMQEVRGRLTDPHERVSLQEEIEKVVTDLQINEKTKPVIAADQLTELQINENHTHIHSSPKADQLTELQINENHTHIHSSPKRKTNPGIAVDQLTELLTRQDSIMEQRLEQCTLGFKEMQERLMKECDDWQQRFVDAEGQLVETRNSLDHAEFERNHLLKVVHDLEVKLQHVSCQSGVDLINKIKEVERHGNITVNLKNGDVEMLRNLDFVPRSSKQQPTAEFSDPRVAGQIIEDLVKIQQLFFVPMAVEGHTKGTDADFFQRLADNRASLIKEHLVACGIDDHYIAAKGFPGPKGLNKPCVIIRLDIFPDND